MNYAFYVLAGLAAFAGLATVTMALLARRSEERERRRARWVSGRALLLIAARLGLDSPMFDSETGEMHGEDDPLQQGETAFELAEHLARGAGYPGRKVLPARLRPPLRSTQAELKYTLFHIRISLASDPEELLPEPLRREVDRLPSRSRRGAEAMSVAEIPFEVFALDQRVRANVLGGLELISTLEESVAESDRI